MKILTKKKNFKYESVFLFKIKQNISMKIHNFDVLLIFFFFKLRDCVADCKQSNFIIKKETILE